MANTAKPVFMGKSKDELRDHAAWLYISKGLSLTEIKERIEIPLKTLSNWKKGRDGEPDWDLRKRLVTSTPLNTKEQIVMAMEKVSRGEKVDIDADQLVKFASALHKIDKQLSVEVITSCLMLLEEFLAKEDPKEAVRCLPFHKKFVLHLINTDGKVR
jgi:hypothetical protein